MAIPRTRTLLGRESDPVVPVAQDGEPVTRESLITPGQYAIKVLNPDGSNVGGGSGGGGASATDGATYIPGVTTVGPTGSLVDEVAPSTAAENTIGITRMTPKRALHVNLRDSAGVELAVGGGTQYTEDAPAAANPTGNAMILVRADSPGAVADADNDNVAARGSNKGELYVKQLDPTPVTDNGGSLTVDGTVSIAGTVPVSDAAGSLTVDTPQLPGALVGGRVDVNNGAWLGSTAPTVGQKTMANSLPVAIASDQSAVPVSGNVGITGTPTVDTELTTADLDSGAGTDTKAVVGIALRESGGNSFVGSANPMPIYDAGGSITVDDGGGFITTDSQDGGHVSLGATTDAEATGNGTLIAIVKRLRTLLAGGLPAALVGGRLDINAGSWLGSTAPTVGQKTAANSIPTVLASDQPAVNFKTAVGDEVATVRTTLDPVDGAGTTVPIKFARVNATADGDNTIVAAVASKKIRVLGYALVVTSAGTISIQDSAGTPAILAQFPLVANGGVSYAGGLEAPAFETPSGNGLEINNPAGVDTLGHITYIEV